MYRDMAVVRLGAVEAEAGLDLGPVDDELQACGLLGVAGVVPGHLDVAVREGGEHQIGGPKRSLTSEVPPRTGERDLDS